MKRYLFRYKFSWMVTAVILFLSFFTVPQTDLDEQIIHIDKLVHICMYGGLSSIIWFEHLRSHPVVNLPKALCGALLLPILMSGTIELLQEYATSNRSGDWADLIANCLGAFLASCFFIPNRNTPLFHPQKNKEL